MERLASHRRRFLEDARTQFKTVEEWEEMYRREVSKNRWCRILPIYELRHAAWQRGLLNGDGIGDGYNFIREIAEITFSFCSNGDSPPETLQQIAERHGRQTERVAVVTSLMSEFGFLDLNAQRLIEMLKLLYPPKPPNI